MRKKMWKGCPDSTDVTSTRQLSHPACAFTDVHSVDQAGGEGRTSLPEHTRKLVTGNLLLPYSFIRLIRYLYE